MWLATIHYRACIRNLDFDPSQLLFCSHLSGSKSQKIVNIIDNNYDKHRYRYTIYYSCYTESPYQSGRGGLWPTMPAMLSPGDGKCVTAAVTTVHDAKG